MEIEDMRTYLTWLITPQNEKESELFKSEGLVDTYIELVSKIPTMSFQELVTEINNQLEPYGKSLDLLEI